MCVFNLHLVDTNHVALFTPVQSSDKMSHTYNVVHAVP